MGEFTLNSRPAAPFIKTPRALHLRIDVPLTLAVSALLIIGFFFVFSASWQYASYNNEASTVLLIKQVAFAGLGILVIIGVNLFDYRRYQPLVMIGVALVIVALIIVLVFGEERNGAVRSLPGGSVQPSEFAKLAVIVYLSYWLNSKREVINTLTLGLLPLVIILGFFMALVILQPDFSAAATIFLLGGMLFFLAGGEVRQIFLVLLAALLLGGLVITISSTGQQRITDWLAGLQDPENSSRHVLRSIEAIVRGGFFGVGLGRSVTKFTGLPVPWTDSIFAVIIEETGLIGALAVVGLYLVFLWRGLAIARQAPDLLGRLLAGGITFWVVLEAAINMGQMVNLVPFAGNALPLISAGGSNMLAMLTGVGLLINVARASKKEAAESDGRIFSAVVDMRRRDRRGRVPRPIRSVNPEG